jgi:anti-sigma factor RsiW
VEEAMTCTDYQQRISKLHDGELPSEESAEVFQHLGVCGECRRFYFELQALDGAIRRIADAVPASMSAKPPTMRFPVQHSLWDRRIALRVPVAALLLCIIIAGMVALLPGSSLLREPQAIYVTKLPTVVVEATASSPRQ